MHPRIPLLVLAMTLIGLTGCAPASGASPSPRPDVTTPSTGTVCSNPEGGSCVGALEPGQRYTTRVLDPAISYEVPVVGWRNEEDLPGNFLLLPPGNTLSGVNAGTSDFIGVYPAVGPGRFADPPGCAFEPVDGVASTPAALASWFQHLDGVIATAPVPVAVGGLRGVRVDLRLSANATIPYCVDAGTRIDVLPLTQGLERSSFEHGLIRGETWRQYLLAHDGRVLGIEIDDVEAAPGTLDSLSAVAERIRFGP